MCRNCSREYRAELEPVREAIAEMNRNCSREYRAELEPVGTQDIAVTTLRRFAFPISAIQRSDCRDVPEL